MINSHPPFPFTPILRRALGALLFACFLFAPASIRAQSTVDDVPFVDAARIRGTVVDSKGKGIPNIRVRHYVYEGAHGSWFFNDSYTDSNGKFVVHATGIGNYLYFSDDSGTYLAEYYNDKSSLETADEISLAEDEVRTVAVELRKAPYITGTVTDEQGNPVEGVQVYPNSTQSGSPAITDADGHYTLGPLNATQYPINFYKFGYIIEEYYKDQPSKVDADLVDLTNVDSAVVDATVTHYGYFSGYVTDLNGEPLEDTFVKAYYLEDDGDWESSFIDSTYTDENGYYQIAGSPDYEYRIGFLSNFSRHPDHFVAEYYPNEPTLAEGRSVTVPVQSLTSNINATLRLTREVEADFVGAPLTGTVPLTVDFMDHSQGGILNNVWNFGDGGTSTAINASHTYTTAGVYTVTLAVTGAANTHTMTQTSYITVADVPIVDLQLTQSTAGSDPAATPMVGEMLYFSATAGGTGVQYLWDFGDEPAIVASVATTATGQYVQHAYAAAGTYTVTLTASNSKGEQTTTHEVTIIGVPSAESTLLLPKLER